MSEIQNREDVLAISSLFDLCEILAAGSGGVWHKEGFDIYSVPETFWYNRVKLNGGLSNSLSAVIAQVADGADSGQLPTLLCYSETDYPGEALPVLLRRYGYKLHTTQAAMYMPLSASTNDEFCELPEIIGIEDLEKWSAVTAPSLGKTSESKGFSRLQGEEGCYFLVWREDHETVGGLLLVCRDSHAGIHEVAVQKEYRGTGIASKLVQCAFEIAARNGCKAISLQASEMGAPLYSKLGMKKTGLFYTWIKEK